MWHQVRGEALVSVFSIYNPPPPFTLYLCRFKKKISFSFRLPLFKNHFCVCLLRLSLSIPPYRSLSSSNCLPSLSPGSPCVVLISDRHCSRSQRGTRKTAAQKFWRKKENALGKHHSPRRSPFLFFFFFFDVFNFSHLPPSIDKKKTSIHSQSVNLSVDIFMLLGGNFKSTAQQGGRRTEKFYCIDMFI